MPDSKKGRITREIQKSIALAGTFFCGKKDITLIYAMWGIDLSLFRVDSRGDPNRDLVIFVNFLHRIIMLPGPGPGPVYTAYDSSNIESGAPF